MTVQSVSLGDLLTLVRRKVDVVADGQYPEIGVRSYGRGLFHKQPRSGLEVGPKELFLVHEGDFILQVTFAWEGAVAVAKSEDHGLYGSVRMLTFRVDENRCLPEFLQFYFRTPAGVEQLVRISPGSAGRNRVLNKSRLPEVFVPLPPLAEQRRIVAKIERLAGKIEEARGLRETANRHREYLQVRLSASVFAHAKLRGISVPISSTFAFRNELIRPHDGSTGQIRFVGLQHIESHTGLRLGEDYIQSEELPGRKFRFRPGDIVYGYLRPYLNKVWIADCNGYCSVDQYVLAPLSDRIETEYLARYLRSESFLDQAIKLTHNLMLPRLRSALFGNISIPLVPLDVQRRMIAYLDSLQVKVDRMKTMQTHSAAELDALLPAILDRAFKGEL